MPETTFEDDQEDFQYWLNLYQIQTRLPKLNKAMNSLKDSYSNRPWQDRTLIREIRINDKKKKVPVYPLIVVMSEAQAALDDNDA